MDLETLDAELLTISLVLGTVSLAVVACSDKPPTADPAITLDPAISFSQPVAEEGERDVMMEARVGDEVRVSGGEVKSVEALGMNGCDRSCPPNV